MMVGVVFVLHRSVVHATVLPWDAANVPGPGWPAATAEESNAAWPAGQQPSSLVAWPQTVDDRPAACWNTTVLEDTHNGWPGQCVGLSRVDWADNVTKCEQACQDEPLCSVWQFNNRTRCWTGRGRECDFRDANDDVVVERAQRLQHGVVRVLKNMQGWHVDVLRPLGFWHTGGVDEGVTHCRNWCYSDIRCQYWQYGSDGCWVEDPNYYLWRNVRYPLTTERGGATSQSDWAKTMVAGEYIQHICPVREDHYASSMQSSSGWSFLPQAPWSEGAPANAWVPWLSVLALLVVGGCLGCTLLGRGHDGGTRPQRKKRAVSKPRRAASEPSSTDTTKDEELSSLSKELSTELRPLIAQSEPGSSPPIAVAQSASGSFQSPLQPFQLATPIQPAMPAGLFSRNLLPQPSLGLGNAYRPLMQSSSSPPSAGGSVAFSRPFSAGYGARPAAP